jgi:pyruvyl transferase EpsO
MFNADGLSFAALPPRYGRGCALAHVRQFAIEDRMADTRPPSELARHQRMMGRLKQRLAGITSVIPVDRPIVYLDYPVHNNVGDLLIHQGADAFLDDYGYDVLGRFSMHDFSRRGLSGEASVELKPSIRDLDALLSRKGVVLVFHGGGNFGDIWPQFQMFREMMIERYRNTPIVILPQSIHFTSPEKRRQAARILARHKQLFIFVRDAESLSFVRHEGGGSGEMMPDMAHQLWGRAEFASGQGAGTLVLRRRDRESHGLGDNGTDHFDWDELNRGASRFVLRALRKWQTIDNPLRHWLPNYQLWRIYRDHLIRRAVARFRPYDGVDTDRLHGVILGALMSKQVRYSEGSYGKLNRYAGLWLADSSLIESEKARQAAE